MQGVKLTLREKKAAERKAAEEKKALAAAFGNLPPPEAAKEPEETATVNPVAEAVDPEGALIARTKTAGEAPEVADATSFIALPVAGQDKAREKRHRGESSGRRKTKRS